MIYNSEQIGDFKRQLIQSTPILGIDYGEKLLGIAKTDDDQIMSMPLDVLSTNDTKSLKEVILKYKVCAIIIGYPLQMDGQEGANCKKVLHFIKSNLGDFSLPIYLQDERLTTKMAQQFLAPSNFTRKKKDFLDNKIAASIILESYLNFAISR